MFFSLSKKFIYIMLLVFIFISMIFLCSFYVVYGQRIQEEQLSVFRRNQQYVQLLLENISLRKELNRGRPGNNKDITRLENELSFERRSTAAALRSYNSRYESIKNGINIILFSALLITFLLIVLWFLINHFIIKPINRLSEISLKITAGDLSLRLSAPHRRLRDELDILSDNFNKMISTLSDNIIEIRQREHFLQSLIDGIPDGICVIAPDGSVIITNQTYNKQIGSGIPPACGKCYTLHYARNEICAKNTACPIRAVINQKQQRFQSIHQFAQAPGKHFAINAAPVTFSSLGGREETCIVLAIRDLSDEIRFSHQQKLSSLGFLATSVAHEMKNHLGAIRMIVEGLLNKIPANASPIEQKYLHLIDNQLIECIKVPERLLRLAHNPSGDDPAPVSCQDNIKEVLNLLDYEAKHNGIIINTDFPDEDLKIIGNDIDFKMMIINLLQNAFKAMPQNGILTLNIRRNRKKQIIINIQDNGRGIPARNLPHIFEPFFTDGSSAAIKGTGLGLAIVKSIVESFGGTITVKSKEHQGTTFTLAFPPAP